MVWGTQPSSLAATLSLAATDTRDVCVCVCVCVRAYSDPCVHAYVYACVCARARARVCVRACVCVCVCVWQDMLHVRLLHLEVYFEQLDSILQRGQRDVDSLLQSAPHGLVNIPGVVCGRQHHHAPHLPTLPVRGGRGGVETVDL